MCFTVTAFFQQAVFHETVFHSIQCTELQNHAVLQMWLSRLYSIIIDVILQAYFVVSS